jgi:hypothetical protein
MNAYILPLLRFVLAILTAVAVGFSVIQITFAGIAMIGNKPGGKEEAAGKIKWIIVGLIASLSTYFLGALVTHIAIAVAPNTAYTNSIGTSTSGLMALPGTGSSLGGIGGWIESEIFSAASAIMQLIAAVEWALTGFIGPTGMALNNLQVGTNGDIMGIFSPTTWSTIMYVQHSLYFVIAVAALISFMLQGIQIQNSPSSGVAKERAATLVKNIIVAGLMLGGTPYLLGLANATVADFAQYIQQLMGVHTAALANSVVGDIVFSPGSLDATAFKDFKLFSGVGIGSSLANSFFAMVMFLVNLLMWLVYQWRRVVLAMLLALMPLFYIGLVTGKRTDLIIHWWKEVLAYMLVPVVALLFLYVAQVFIGI